MKKKFMILSSWVLLIASLASCGDTPSTPSSSANSTTPSITSTGTSSSTSTGTASSASSSASSVDEWKGKTNKDFQKASNTYGEDKKALNMQTLFENAGDPHLNPLEEQHILVVPFGFTDSNLKSVQTKDNIDRINTTFFGSQEEINQIGGWISVADYYNKSSYGKATFKGNILPNWVEYDGSSTEFANSNKGNYGIAAAEYTRKYYLAEYAKENHGALGEDAKPLSYYDHNGDGFIDLMWIVYSHPIGDNIDGWWAYVTYTQNKPAEGAGSENGWVPNVKTLGWASINFLDEGFGGYDPHTFIHETGHTFGLYDYYDYNKKWSPLGKVDMMDNNIGDHNAFSKFSLGWLSPLVVDDTARITLYPTTTTGDCFILPSTNYNNTCFDEYMMVEFMAPVGLAEQDYKNNYKSVQGFSKPGIRITHVDARVYNTDHDTYLATNPEEGTDLRLSNTYGGRAGVKRDSDYLFKEDGSKSYFSLISILDSTIPEKDYGLTFENYNATNDSLFKKGQRFNLRGDNNPWATKYMPSGTNLWNKAKTTTGWVNNTDELTQEIDTTYTMDYSLKVVDIQQDETYGYKAIVDITKN